MAQRPLRNGKTLAPPNRVERSDQRSTYSKSATDASTSVAITRATNRSRQGVAVVEMRCDHMKHDSQSTPEEKLAQSVRVVHGPDRAERDEGDECHKRPIDRAHPDDLPSRRNPSEIPDRPTADDGLERDDLRTQDMNGFASWEQQDDEWSQQVRTRERGDEPSRGEQAPARRLPGPKRGRRRRVPQPPRALRSERGARETGAPSRPSPPSARRCESMVPVEGSVRRVFSSTRC